VFANDWVSELTGRPRGALLGLGWLAAMHRDDRPAFDVAWRSAVEGSGEFALEPLVDVTPARRAREELRDLARTDPLTGLANRRLWDERLAVELARAARSGQPLCVAALDLVKPHNDQFGHAAGDELLRATTAGWRGVLRASDLLSRLGGDEFAVLLPDCDAPYAQAIVGRLQEVLPAEDDGVGCSAGLVAWEPGEGAGARRPRALRGQGGRARRDHGGVSPRHLGRVVGRVERRRGDRWRHDAAR
jgi:diguanylate cyclase (GGDEF)-like protein